MVTFRSACVSPLSLRQQYLEGLAEPQEWFLESLIRQGQIWALEDGTYGIVRARTLLEFFSPDPELTGMRLKDFQMQQGFTVALVKSYDLDLVTSCAQLGWRSVVAGFLFRKRAASHPAIFDDAAITAATCADVDMLWQINDGFFDSKTEMADLLASDALWTVTVDGKIAGCGLTNRVLQHDDAVDIGMMTAPAFRRMGLGTYIVNALANATEREGLCPICGCAAGNIGSPATLKKAGFLFEHQLLRFEAT